MNRQSQVKWLLSVYFLSLPISHSNLSFALLLSLSLLLCSTIGIRLVLLERVLHLLGVGGGGGQSCVVQVLGDLSEFLKHLSALSLQLLTELLGLSHNGSHLGLELLLVLL